MSELQENAEHGHERPSLAPVSLTMAILAMLLAAVTLLGHRAHTEEVILQNKVTDQWAFYQAKNIRRHNYETMIDLLSVQTSKNPEQVEALKAKYEKQVERYKDELKEAEEEARKITAETDHERRRADRFDLGEGFLEVALVITSITLLTSKRSFWYLGIIIGVSGLAVAATGFLVH